MKYLYLLFVLVLLVGCTETIPTDDDYLLGGDKDEYGCIGSAGYSWCEVKQKCLRTWEEPCVLSDEHICTAEESQAIACTMEYAPVCGKIILNTGEIAYQTFGNGCGACAAMKVVSYIPGECPVENVVDSCTDTEGNILTMDEAIVIATSSECGTNLVLDCVCPDGYRKEGETCIQECYHSSTPCDMPSVQCENTYQCNEATGTYWIDLDIVKEGCNPACVIDVASKTAEINWRCTGLLI